MLRVLYLKISFLDVFFWYSWGDIQVPWDPLDEDGNEEEFEDTVSLSPTRETYFNCYMMNRFSIEHQSCPRDGISSSVANGARIPGPAHCFCLFRP